MLVSVIVPVYNSQQYIQRCLESIINQTYRELEIIVIDDGSTDKSLDIVKNFNDKRIRVFKKENSGVCDARNLGISKSSGDLVLFVDSDDYIDKDMLLKMTNEVTYIDSTFIMCNNFEIYEKKLEERVIFEEEKLTLDKEKMLRVISNGKAGLVCSKLISMKIIRDNKIFFDKNIKIGEDQLFFANIANNCKEFKYIKESLYFYDRRNENSATAKYKEGLINNFLYIQNKIEGIFLENGMTSYEDKKIINNKIMSWFLYCLFNEVRGKKTIGIKNTIKELKILVNKVNSILDFNFIENSSPIYIEISKCIKRNNRFSILKLLVIGQVLILKNK